MKLNKKGSQMMAWGLLATMFILVITAYIYIWSKTSKFTSTTGETQSEIIKNYHNGELALIYTDQAAKYSAYNSIYSIAQKAGYFNEPPCKYSPIPEGTNYALWQAVHEQFEDYLPTGKFTEYPCYPTESDIRKSFTLSFNKEFNDYAEEYTPTIIPKNNYDIVFEEKEDKVGITGIATQKIRFPPDPTQYKEMVLLKLSEMEQNCLSKEGYTPIFGGGDLFRACAPCPEKANCEAYVNEIYCKMDPCNLGCRWEDGCKKATSIYAITPPFKTEISYNFIKKFNVCIEKAKAVEKSMEDCLRIGSGELYDVDIIVCTDINKLKKEIEGIDTYEITALPPEDDTPLLSYPHIKVPSKKYYTLLFKVGDSSLQNPFSNEKFEIKFALQLLDDIPPPKTEIKTFYNANWPEYDLSTDLLYLKWEMNPASDVLAYWIYYKKTSVDKSPPTLISEMDNYGSADIIWAQGQSEGVTWDTTKWQIDRSLVGDYYFIVVAQDKFDNKATELAPKIVHIPAREEIEAAKKPKELIWEGIISG